MATPPPDPAEPDHPSSAEAAGRGVDTEDVDASDQSVPPEEAGREGVAADSGGAGRESGPEPSTLRLWFRPAMIGLHLLLVVSVVGCVVGGFWQYGSYERQQSAEQVERAAMAPVPLADAWPAGEPFTTTQDQRRVEVQGEFAPAQEQVWVSRRTQDGQDGFWLLAPLVVAGEDDALLLVRGFATEPGALPPVPSGEQALTAVLRPSEGEGATLDADRVIGTVRVPLLLNELGRPLYTGYAISMTDTGAGLPLADPPEPDVSWTVGLTNLAYAFQWWVFALFAVFLWWRMCTDQVADARARLRRT